MGVLCSLGRKTHMPPSFPERGAICFKYATYVGVSEKVKIPGQKFNKLEA